MVYNIDINFLCDYPIRSRVAAKCCPNYEETEIFYESDNAVLLFITFYKCLIITTRISHRLTFEKVFFFPTLHGAKISDSPTPAFTNWHIVFLCNILASSLFS